MKLADEDAEEIGTVIKASTIQMERHASRTTNKAEEEQMRISQQ